jgi:hypothetical protein
MSVALTQEGDSFRVKTDRAGERAVSDLLSRSEAVDLLSQLAGLLGYSIVTADPQVVSNPGESSGDDA